MITREDVADIINYCQTHQITYKARLQELDIPTWRFYEAKAKYAEEDLSDKSQGSFIQLKSGDSFIPTPSFAAKPGRKSKRQSDEPRNLSVELRMPNGTMMRISGEMDTKALQSIILASCGHVQP